MKPLRELHKEYTELNLEIVENEKCIQSYDRRLAEYRKPQQKRRWYSALVSLFHRLTRS